jgi:phosphoribosylformylglycinamidine cyclo-ligase
VAAGDVVLGLPASGVHANGLSLVRHALTAAGVGYDQHFAELGQSIGAELLIPTRLYVEPVLALLSQLQVKAAAHVTGGGLLGRSAKLAGAGLRIVIDPDRYVRPPIFNLIAQLGGIAESELARTFNMGLGFLVVVAQEELARLPAAALGDWAVVGRVVSGRRGADLGYAAD